MKYFLPIAGVSILLVLTSSLPADASASHRMTAAVPPAPLLTLGLLQDAEHGEAVTTNSHGESASGEDQTDAGGHGEADLGQQRAAKLAVHAPPAWYGKVVWGAGLLFVLAATLGSAAIVLKGPEPPDPADDHGGHH